MLELLLLFEFELEFPDELSLPDVELFEFELPLELFVEFVLELVVLFDDELLDEELFPEAEWPA